MKVADGRAGLRTYLSLEFGKRRTIDTIVVVGVFLLAFSEPWSQAQGQRDWRALVGRYEAGQYEVVRAALTDALSTPAAVSSFVRETDKTTAGIADAVAASFLLEAGAAAYASEPNAALDLIDKGRGRVKGARRDIELAWYLAAIAWLQGPYPSGANATHLRSSVSMPGGLKIDAVLSRGDDYLKSRDDWIISGGVSKDVFAPMFLEHALRRFPDDWNLQFARAVFDTASVFNYLKTYALVLQAPLPNDTRFRFAHSDTRNLAESFAAVVTRAPQHDRPRANLYLGFLRYFDLTAKDGFRLRPEDALLLWRDAAGSTDPDVVYVALLLQASILWKQPGKLGTAIEVLQKAHAMFPEAQTVPRLLASLLYVTGNADAAGTVVVQLLDAKPGDDPWLRFLRGDFDRWPSRLQALRALLN